MAQTISQLLMRIIVLQLLFLLIQYVNNTAAIVLNIRVEILSIFFFIEKLDLTKKPLFHLFGIHYYLCDDIFCGFGR